MPEVYIEDVGRMEPILHVEKIEGIWRKLVCNLCQIRTVVCLRCSHGMSSHAIFFCGLICKLALPGSILVIRCHGILCIPSELLSQFKMRCFELL